MKLGIILSIFLLIIIPILVAMIIMIVKYQYLFNYTNQSYISTCYLGGGEGEWGERDIAYKYTDPKSKVLEFGGGAGSVSQVVQHILNDPTKHVVIQPDDDGQMFGGLKQLNANKTSCNSSYKIINHVLQEGDITEVTNILDDNPDVIIADCEGCLYNEYKKNPDLFANENLMIQVERDDFDNSYDNLFTELNMEKLHTGFHQAFNMEVWKKKQT